ncbi:MAG: hypothetical protein EPN43_08480 [Jatrophihabitans sp.]|nr:MAG: hypothetical protein EPN43_08480 [Jatrophihabitans sp.]
MSTTAQRRASLDRPGRGWIDHNWRTPHYLALAVIALLQTLVRADVPLGQDAYWEARYGLDVIRTGSLPRADTYSWTAHGAPWIPSSWAWNVVLGSGYDAMGYLGLWVLAAAVSVLSALAIAAVARRAGARPWPTLAVYAPIGMLGLESVPRAQTLSNVAAVLVAVLAGQVMTRCGRRAVVGWLLVLCAVQIAWMNLHSMALLGPVLAAAAGLAVLAGRRTADRRAVGRLVVITATTAASCLATPYGVEPITHAAAVRAASVGLVTEWVPAGFGSVSQFLTLIAVAAGVVLCVRAWRGQRFVLAACLLVLAVATASAIRFLPMLAVAATPEVALAVGALRVREGFMRFCVAAVAVVLAALGATGWRDLAALDPLVSPGLVRAIPGGCRLLNDDLAGDAVVLARPDVRVSLDGRNDMYGRARVEKVLDEFANRPGTMEQLDRQHVGCVLGPSSMALVQALRSQPGWRVAGQDTLRTLLVLSEPS